MQGYIIDTGLKVNSPPDLVIYWDYFLDKRLKMNSLPLMVGHRI